MYIVSRENSKKKEAMLPEVIAHVTDMHLSDEISHRYGVDSVKNTERVIDDILSKKIKYVFFTGDNGRIKDFREILLKLKSHNVTSYYTLGNHDEPKESFSLLADSKISEKFYYTFYINNYQIIFLNSGKGRIDQDQLLWLEEQIANQSKKLIFIHHPILACDETILDQEYPLENRMEVQKILGQSTEEIIIFAGHYHNEYFKQQRNIKQFVSPSCQLQYVKSKEQILTDKSYGYRIISLNLHSVSSKVVLFEK